MSKIIGIDLGTTNSCMAIIDGGQPIIIPNSEGNRLTPSIVAFPNNNEILVGESAKRQALLNPQNTITSVKKLIGKKYFEVKEFIKKIPYNIIETAGGFVGIKVLDTVYTPQEISAFILQKMKIDAEAHLATEISEAVITVPDRFGKAEIKATIEAAEIAGLKIRRVISEPTSACLAFGLGKKNQDSLVAIFDLGGGSLDVSLIDISAGVFDVLSSFGDLNLGGNDFDFVIIDWLLKEIEKKEKVDLSRDPMVIHRFREAAETAKIELSESMSTNIRIPFISIGSVIKDLEFILTREIFEKISAELIEKCKKVCYKAMRDGSWKSYVRPSSEVIFVGGSTRIPFLKEAISCIFNIQLNKKVNPDEIVALGASVQGGVLTGEIKDILLLNSTSYNFGIKAFNEKSEEKFTTILAENSTIPTRIQQSFLNREDYEFAKSREKKEQGNGQEKESKDKEIKYGYLKPVKVTSDGLQFFEMIIIESDGVSERQVGKLSLNEIPSLENKPNEIVVIFDIDANNILRVTAFDKDSRRNNEIVIDVTTGLAQSELSDIRKRFKNIEENKKESKKNQAILNSAHAILFQSEKQMLSYADYISNESKSHVLVLLDELRHCVKNKEANRINTIINSLNKLWQYISQEIYLGQTEKKEVEEGPAKTEAPQEVQIFISYSHKDESYKNKLINNLAPLKRRKLISIWNDRNIISGTLWEDNGIYKNLESAQIIVLLVSSDFIASDYCFDKEIEKAFARHKLNEVLLIPIIIRPTRWQNLEIGKLQALPKDGLPISKWANEDDAWENVIEGIEKAVEYIMKGKLKRKSI